MCGSQNASYLDREDPDLPLCVEQTVLVWIPLGFLWICAPWHLASLCGRTNVNTKHLSKLYLIKQVMHTATGRELNRTELNWIEKVSDFKVQPATGAPWLSKTDATGERRSHFVKRSLRDVFKFLDFFFSCVQGGVPTSTFFSLTADVTKLSCM